MNKVKAIRYPFEIIRMAFVTLLAAGSIIIITANPSNARVAGESFADLVDQISPAVVNIVTSVTITGPSIPDLMVPEGSPLEDLFRDFLDRQEHNGPQRRGEALGSGFIISADGYIVTNDHVIEGADEIVVEFFEGGTLVAQVIGRDAKTDIAVLKVETDEPLPFVKFGDSDIARVGDWVMAIGNPLGQGFSVSAGIISARNRELSGSYDDFIQTDAAINQGNSGGPLFNMNGEVIGVNTAILSPNGGSIGIGFSMSSSVVSRVVAQLMEHGETQRGWLGVRIQGISEDVAAALEIETTEGALVTDVPTGPALDAGIEPGDVIIKFDGKDVVGTGELVRMVADTDVGKAVRVVVLRDGKTQTILVTIGRLENSNSGAVSTNDTMDDQEYSTQGMDLGMLSQENREKFGLGDFSEGVLILEVDRNSQAFEKGLRAGDVIAELGQSTVSTPNDVLDGIEEARQAGRTSILLLVHRDGDKRFVALLLD